MEKTNNANFIKVLYSSCFILFIIIFNNGDISKSSIYITINQYSYVKIGKLCFIHVFIENLTPFCGIKHKIKYNPIEYISVCTHNRIIFFNIFSLFSFFWHKKYPLIKTKQLTATIEKIRMIQTIK